MAGYLIGTIEVKNPEAYKEYLAKVTDIVKKFGGEYLVRAGEYTEIEGVDENDLFFFHYDRKSLEKKKFSWYLAKLFSKRMVITRECRIC